MDREKREVAARAQAEDLKRERAAEKEKQGAEDRQRREKEPERHSDDRWAAGAAGIWGSHGGLAWVGDTERRCLRCKREPQQH